MAFFPSRSHREKTRIPATLYGGRYTETSWPNLLHYEKLEKADEEHAAFGKEFEKERKTALGAAGETPNPDTKGKARDLKNQMGSGARREERPFQIRHYIIDTHTSELDRRRHITPDREDDDAEVLHEEKESPPAPRRAVYKPAAKKRRTSSKLGSKEDLRHLFKFDH